MAGSVDVFVGPEIVGELNFLEARIPPLAAPAQADCDSALVENAGFVGAASASPPVSDRVSSSIVRCSSPSVPRLIAI